MAMDGVQSYPLHHTRTPWLTIAEQLDDVYIGVEICKGQ